MRNFLLNKLYKEGKAYTIPFGKLRGAKLYYRSDINYGEMLGLWEKKSLYILLRVIESFGFDKKQIIAADVGSNLGLYSLFFSRKLYPGSQIVAFEPSEAISDLLKNNIALNQADNVKIEYMACSDVPGEIEFYIGENHHQSSFFSERANMYSPESKKIVKSTSLDVYFAGQAGLPDLIKMDIEGGGVYALKGCNACFKEKRSILLIESHTSDEDFAISKVILEYNYEALRINNMKWVTKKDKNYTDPDGVWGTMLLLPAELKSTFRM